MFQTRWAKNNKTTLLGEYSLPNAFPLSRSARPDSEPTLSLARKPQTSPREAGCLRLRLRLGGLKTIKPPYWVSIVCLISSLYRARCQSIPLKLRFLFLSFLLRCNKKIRLSQGGSTLALPSAETSAFEMVPSIVHK